MNSRVSAEGHSLHIDKPQAQERRRTLLCPGGLMDAGVNAK